VFLALTGLELEAPAPEGKKGRRSRRAA